MTLVAAFILASYKPLSSKNTAIMNPMRDTEGPWIILNMNMIVSFAYAYNFFISSSLFWNSFSR